MRVAYFSYRAQVFQNKCLSITAKLNLYTVLGTYMVPNSTRMSSNEDIIIEASN